MRGALESDGDRVADLHVWSVGPGLRAAIVSVVSHHHRSVDDYKARLPYDLGIVHLTGTTSVPRSARRLRRAA